MKKVGVISSNIPLGCEGNQNVPYGEDMDIELYLGHAHDRDDTHCPAPSHCSFQRGLSCGS